LVRDFVLLSFSLPPEAALSKSSKNPRFLLLDQLDNTTASPAARSLAHAVRQVVPDGGAHGNVLLGAPLGRLAWRDGGLPDELTRPTVPSF